MNDFSHLRYVSVDGRRMAYRDVGGGTATVVFLHGNPTSAYFWRNVVPHVQDFARCIAPDLIGMGDSDKLPSTGARTYGYFVNRHYLDGVLSTLLPARDVILVGHNWGAPLAFDWAQRHAAAVRGLVHIEGQIAPMSSSQGGERFKMFNARARSPEMARAILEDNAYLEQYFFPAFRVPLAAIEREAYTRPFLTPGEGRRPMIDWPLEIPVDGEPADVHERLLELKSWMNTNPIPKLFLRPTGNSIMVGNRLETARGFANQMEVDIPGGQFAPEEAPNPIGIALANWLRSLGG